MMHAGAYSSSCHLQSKCSENFSLTREWVSIAADTMHDSFELLETCFTVTELSLGPGCTATLHDVGGKIASNRSVSMLPGIC